VSWEKGHHRLERRRLKRVSVSPEEVGLRGAWQVLAVRRERVFLGRQAKAPGDETGYYITSVAAAQLTDAELLEAVRGHWDATENGSHHRRDVSFGEDACGVSHRGAAQVLACLRNLALGLYELARARGQTKAPGAKSASRRMTFGQARTLLR
jgi:hypothetical protein